MKQFGFVLSVFLFASLLSFGLLGLGFWVGARHERDKERKLDAKPPCIHIYETDGVRNCVLNPDWGSFIR